MSIQKVMGILSVFENQAVSDIKTDRQIKADPYESVGRYKLIRRIKRKINQEFPTNDDDKEAA